MTVASQIKQTLAGLKGAHATLMTYTAQERNQETKTIFSDAMSVTGEVIKDIEERYKILQFQEPQYKDK